MGWASLEEALTLGSGIERSFPCPVHDDTNPSASVNSISGYWVCYSCGAWGHADMDRLELDPLEVANSIRRMIEQMEKAHHRYPEAWLSVFDSAGPGQYWLARFGGTTCRHFRLGQTADRDAATIPMRDAAGKVMGVIRRDLVGAKQKYKYPYGVDVTDYVFDLHRTDTDVLVLTEGATDAIACWEAGFNHGVALYGSRISRAQAKLIKKHSPTRILCAQDQDQAGDKAYEHVRRMLGDYFPVERVHWDTHKDLASIPVQNRREMLSELLQEEPRFELAVPDQTRLESHLCGSPDRPLTGLTSSSSTPRRVTLRMKRSSAGSCSKRSSSPT